MTVQKDMNPEAIQWRNVKKIVRALADLCFGDQDHPKWGVCHLAIVDSLTAKDGIDISTLGLEPLVVSPQEQESALDKYTRLEVDKDETDSVERLRAYCSFAMNGQDWLDVEPFFDAIKKETK